MLRVGLTGGIASGKSTVAAMFVELGATLIDTDIVAREVVARGEPGLAAIRAAFGESLINEDGELDRPKMRRLIFSDAASRARLESILHPMIRERTLANLDELDDPYVLVAVPLLLEKKFDALVDRVLVVDCPTDTQLKRLMQRDQLDQTEAQAALMAQADRSVRLDSADEVIDNSGTLSATSQQVRALHQRYLELAGDWRTDQGHAE